MPEDRGLDGTLFHRPDRGTGTLLAVVAAMTVGIGLVLVVASWSVAVAVCGLGLLLGAVAYPALTRRLPVEIGDDGIAIHRRFVPRFVPYRRLVKIATSEGGDAWAELVLEGDERVRVEPAPRERAAFDAKLARLREAWAATKHRRVDVPPELTRTTDPDAWRAQLVALGAQGFRERSFDRAQGLSIVADPAAPPFARVAAAFVLRDALSDGERRTIRGARAASVNWHLARALDQVLAAGADEIDLRSALSYAFYDAG